MRRYLPLAVLSVAVCFSALSATVPGAQPSAARPAGQAPEWKGGTHLVISAARANFPRLAAWLFNGLYELYPHRGFTGEILFTGSGYAIELHNVIARRAQLAVVTPSATVHMAREGVGLFSSPAPQIRGFFKIGQRDPITFAVRADLGVTSFEEVIARKIPLKIVAPFVDGDDGTGFLFSEVLRAYGTSVADLESWGGKLLNVSWGGPGIALLLAGEGNAIFHEGSVMANPQFAQVHAKTPMRVLSIRDDVIAKVSTFGYRKFEQVIKKGRFPGVEQDVTTIDYSDWIVVGDAAIPDAVAYNIAKAAAENVRAWSIQDQSIKPVEAGELGNLPVDPKTMWKDLGAPLHPGAERYYKEKGLMPASK